MRVWILAVLLALTIGEACSQELVRQVQMLRDRDGEPGEVVTEFRPQDRKKHFRVELDQLALGSRTFQVRYIAEEIADGKEIVVATADVGSLVASEINAHVELPNDWPIGRYRVELLMDGNAIGAHRYIVSPTWSEQVIGYWALYGDRAGEPAGEPIERFRSSQRMLHFQAQTTGYIKRGARLTFQLLDPDGGEVDSTELPIEPDSEVFNILTYQVALPQDWPPGTYRIQAFSGKRLLGAHEFAIVGR